MDYYIREYNAAERRLKWTWYDSEGTLLNYDIYEYDAEDQMIRIREYNANGVLQATYGSDGSRVN